MLSAKQLLNTKQAAHDAVLSEQETKVPAELTIAQWALESGWGAHQPGNNCFGIKAYLGAYGTAPRQTYEFVGGKQRLVTLDFAVFPSLQACFTKHADLIIHGPRYAKAWNTYLQTKDIFRLISGIAPIYATAPDYAQQLETICMMPEVRASLSEFQAALRG